MTAQELIDTLQQGCPVSKRLVSEIILRLKNLKHLEGVAKYYVKENQRLESALSRAEEKYIELREEAR